MADLFISYRRDDTKADAGRLYDRLTQHFGHDRVFMDVDDIPPGTDFVQHLRTTLAGCAAVLVVIGDEWTASDDKTGKPRIADPEDFVHIEVRTALERDVPVVPVLVGGATMPRRDQVPDDLAPLLQRQAVELRHARFSDDVDQLVESLSGSMGKPDAWLSRRTVIACLLAIAVAGSGYLGFRARRSGRVRLRSEPTLITVDDARTMLVRRDFFDARFNAAGTGSMSSPEAVVANGDVAIVDHGTALMWQKSGNPKPMMLGETRKALQRVNENSFAGHADWRLPTLEEAMSLMRPDKHGNYHIDPAFEAGAVPFIWTADRPAPESGWVVYYYDGRCAPEKTRFNAYLRAVRNIDGDG